MARQGLLRRAHNTEKDQLLTNVCRAGLNDGWIITYITTIIPLLIGLIGTR